MPVRIQSWALAVRRVSGHAPGSKEFYRYIALAEDFVQGHVRKAYEKLLEMKGNTNV